MRISRSAAGLAAAACLVVLTAYTGLNAAMGGGRGMILILTNHSGSTCYVYGYPGLAFFNGGGLAMTTHLTWIKAIGQASGNDFGPIANMATGNVLTDPAASTVNGTRLVMENGNGDLSAPWHVSYHHYVDG